jgi:hypothetical protein
MQEGERAKGKGKRARKYYLLFIIFFAFVPLPFSPLSQWL